MPHAHPCHTVLGESWTCFTANTSKYDRSKGTRFAPSSELEVRFELQANANAHVGLFTSGHDLSCMYEIVIGGWNNTQSAIRRSSQGNVLCSVPGPRLDGTLSTKMWMTLSNGRLRIGTSDIVGENEWMCGIDPNPLEIVEVVPMTGWGATGVWKLRVDSSDGSSSLPCLLPWFPAFILVSGVGGVVCYERNERTVQCAVRTVWCALFYERTILPFGHCGLQTPLSHKH